MIWLRINAEKADSSLVNLSLVRHIRVLSKSVIFAVTETYSIIMNCKSLAQAQLCYDNAREALMRGGDKVFNQQGEMGDIENNSK